MKHYSENSPEDQMHEEIMAIHNDWVNNRGLGPDGELLHSLKRLQEMRESGEFCCIEIKSDYDFVWDVKCVHENWTNEQGHKFINPSGGYSHNTLVDAINCMYDWWLKGCPQV